MIVAEDDPAYTSGSEVYQIACELAWDQFPHLFEGGDSEDGPAE